MTSADVARLTTILGVDFEMVPTLAEVAGVARHPEDDLFLSASVSGEVDLMVTGDKQLLALRSYQEIPIVTPAQFLEMLLQA